MQSGKNTVADIAQYFTHEYEIHGQTVLSFEKFKALKYDQAAFEWKQRSFAGKVKEVCSILTGIPVEDFEKQEVKDRVLGEEWKCYVRTLNGQRMEISLDRNYIKDKTVRLSEWAYRHGNAFDNHNWDEHTITVRELLQLVGTDAMRNVIHPNVWVNALFADYIPEYEDGYVGTTPENIKWEEKETYPNWIITDVRFPNEAEAIKSRGGLLIRVNRDRVQPTGNPSIKIALDYTRTGNTITDHSQHPSETSLDSYDGFDEVIDNNGTIEELVEKVKLILIKYKII